MRRQGKSHAAHLAKEAALNTGRSVLVATPELTTLQRRKGHLTLIETMPRKPSRPLVIYDDFYLQHPEMEIKMDCRTMQIHACENQESLQRLSDKLKSMEGRQLAPLTTEQLNEAKPLSKTGRKNYMRNQPCPCGSKNKFKRCCWSKYA